MSTQNLIHLLQIEPAFDHRCPSFTQTVTQRLIHDVAHVAWLKYLMPYACNTKLTPPSVSNQGFASSPGREVNVHFHANKALSKHEMYMDTGTHVHIMERPARGRTHELGSTRQTNGPFLERLVIVDLPGLDKKNRLV